ncbi:Hypothetical_protein [Hexamita inflata]|uniref:Hypothetical_protein n=1 Tax=Hexamita inflata TaxID=28002 RepID=A0AA86TZ18_9EUKA|nr:Hypothetical protein HINF_LOCUS20102 [Hexamita inflata]
MDELDRYRSDIEHLSLAQMDLQRDNSSLQEHIKTLNTTISQLQDQKLLSAKDSYKADIKNASQLQNQVLSLQQELQKVRNQLESQNASRFILVNDSQRALRKTNMTTELVDEQKQKYDNLIQEFNQYKKDQSNEIDTLNQKIQDQSTELQNLQQSLQKCNVQLDLAQKKSEHFKKGALDKQVNISTKLTSAPETEILTEEIKQKIAKLERDNVALKGHIEQLKWSETEKSEKPKQVVQQDDQQIKELKEQIENLQADNDMLQLDLSAYVSQANEPITCSKISDMVNKLIDQAIKNNSPQQTDQQLETVIDAIQMNRLRIWEDK